MFMITHFDLLNTDSSVVLCDFHREKARWEWTSKVTNGVLDVRDNILTLLRNIAKAATISQMNDAINKLQSNDLWKKNDKLKSWMSNTWLPNKEVSVGKLYNCNVRRRSRKTYVVTKLKCH